MEGGYYAKINVEKREAISTATIKELRTTVKGLQERICGLDIDLVFSSMDKDNEIRELREEYDSEIARLNTMHQNEKKKKGREQKMKHYYKQKQTPEKSGSTANTSKQVVHEFIVHDDPSVCVETKTNGVFTTNVRKCVLELASLIIASEKIGPAIKAVGKHLFQHDFEAKDLPAKQCALNIMDEGHWLVKRMYANKLDSSDTWGLRTDGTSRSKNKILDTAITLSSGEHLPLGYNLVATETSISILNNTKDHIHELTEISSDQNFLISIIEKLSYCMSDRAANEKCAKRLLEEWRAETLQTANSDQQATILHGFHCMAHALLGFHSYASKELATHQQDLGMLGRDRDAFLRRWTRKSDVAASRAIRMASEVLGPCGDEKNGVADKWQDYMAEKNVKSHIGAYKDNRFNAVFEVAAQVCHHRRDIINLVGRLRTLGNKNPKVHSVLLDMEDDRLCAIIQALAICYVQVTGLYWDLVTSGLVPYLDLYKYIQELHRKMSLSLQDPLSLADPELSIFQDFQPNRRSPLFVSAMAIENADKPLLKSSLQCIISGITHTVEVQLADFLPTGKYGSPHSEPERHRTRNSGVNNLECERHFGHLDSSQNRRRHATFHHHSTILLLKTKGKNALKWLEDNPAADELWLEARRRGVKLRRKHREMEQYQHLQRQALLLKTKTKTKKQKRCVTQAKAVLKKARKKKRRAAPQVQEKVTVESNKWFAVAYENGWFPGYVLQVVDESTAEIEFLHPTAISGQYRKPARDISIIKDVFIFYGPLAAPVPVSGGRLFTLPEQTAVDNKYRLFCERTWPSSS